MKSKFTLWSVVLLLAGFIFIGCDNERTENASDFQTGIHKIVIQQSGDTDSFEVSVSIGGADKGGPAKLYNDKGEYIGDSYSAQIRTATMSCRQCSLLLLYEAVYPPPRYWKPNRHRS